MIVVNKNQNKSGFKYLYFNETERRMYVSNNCKTWTNVIIDNSVLSDIDYISLKQRIKKDIDNGSIEIIFQ